MSGFRRGWTRGAAALNYWSGLRIGGSGLELLENLVVPFLIFGLGLGLDDEGWMDGWMDGKKVFG